MSNMTFTVRDAHRRIWAERHASLVNALLPALSDDPETIEELQWAMQRFLPPGVQGESLAEWSPGESDDPCGAGICIVDLPGRLIVHQSTFCEFVQYGHVSFDEGDPKTWRWVPYHISHEWLATGELAGWRVLAGERHRKRQTDSSLDTRAALYGGIAPFLVEQCFSARGGSTTPRGTWSAPSNWRWQELHERTQNGKPIFPSDAIAEIHARWLMTPRQDLHGRTPREIMHLHREHIDQQLQDREVQWSTYGQNPAPLDHDSIAYRYGGYGTHEIVTYYELVRQLTVAAWELIVARSTDHPCPTREQALDRLRVTQQDWLSSPELDDFAGRTPQRIIESERLRLPICLSSEEAIIDADCPLCRMLAENGPVFWHLDGCNMDPEFPFALFESTREEWEEQQQDQGEFGLEINRETLAERRHRDALPPISIVPEVNGGGPSVWQHSLVRSEPNEPVAITLFGVGVYLAELIEDLRRVGQSRAWIESLNRDFENLRQATADPSHALLEPVFSKFGSDLIALSETQPALSVKCLDLQRHLAELEHSITQGREDEELS